jgi:hypothetical protein
MVVDIKAAEFLHIPAAPRAWVEQMNWVKNKKVIGTKDIGMEGSGPRSWVLFTGRKARNMLWERVCI